MSVRSKTAAWVGKKTPELTGFKGGNEEAVPRERPLSLAWISDGLLAGTIDVFSEAYGQPIGEEEAVDILMNIKRLGEVLLEAGKEMNRT